MLKKALFLSVIAATIWSLYYYHTDPSTEQSNTYKIPQEYMHDLAVVHFTEQGTIRDKIYAHYWAYLPEKEYSELEHPYLEVLKPNGSMWIIKSEFAKAKHKTLDNKAEELELLGKVIAERPATNQVEHIRVTSEHLFYNPKDESAKTDKFVRMIKPDLEITGIGMYGFLNKNWVEIYNNVTTRYENNS